METFIINSILWTLALYGLFELVKQIINMITYTNLKADGIYIIIAVKNQEEKIEGFLRSSLFKIFYGKEEYIKDIIVADLGSTDGTKDILEEYVGKYAPLTILFEEENQFTKGLYHFKERTLPLVKGKYIALCEGDDYWTDEYKLQKQFDALENHPEINISH